jgi:ketosteroid isomerase-like protein
MDINIQTIERFYSAFAQKDYQAMNSCYSNEVVFFDPMFELLRGEQVKAMWEMLCMNAKDFSLTYGNIKNLGDGYYTCDWQARYTFSKTGRPVVNNVTAHMKMDEGQVLEHSDAFSLHQWSKQALGFPGWLLGWNSFFQRRIKNSARKGLLNFMDEG